MTERNNINYYTRESNTVPSRTDLLEIYTGRRYYGPVAKQASFSTSWYRPNTPQIEEIFSKMINDVVKNDVTPEIAIETAVRDINALNPNR